MNTNSLPHASPERLGIPTAAILTFLDELENKRLPMHSFILLRHGQIAAEGYWPPFDAGRKHRMYSVSKSFTAVAIGMLVDEGKISLQDKVADSFPEYLPERPHPYVLEATVEHLLKMATFNVSTAYTFDSPDFVAAFFQDERPKHKPGAFFFYDTAATTVLCALVEKLTGKRMLEYMRPVLDAIGFSEDAWCIQSPEGRSWTGSGILCTPRDLARFALLCMNKGAWEGKQLVSQAYMEKATSPQIDNTVSRNAQGRAFGYGYQFWALKDGGFGCFGMGSQFAFCMPAQDAILVTTADTQGITGADEVVLDAFYRLLGKMSGAALPEDVAAQATLQARIAALSLPLPVGRQTTPLASVFSGKTYVFEENKHGFAWMRMDISDDACTLHYQTPTGTHQLRFGMGHYAAQRFPEKYFGERIGIRDRHYETLAAAAWTADNALVATVCSVDDYLGTLKLQITFSKEDVCVFMAKTAEGFFEEYQGFLAGYART